jgi:neutral ceramidase
MNKSFLVSVAVLVACAGGWAQEFKAGAARRDVTPTEPIPMWGYGARHDYAATGTKAPLFTKALVLDCGNGKVALVGVDMGRSPTYAMMDAITAAVKEQSGVDHVMIVGSHTHHGPTIELLDQPGYGKGTWDASVRYSQWLQQQYIDMINEAAKNAAPAKIGWAVEDTDFNRNRQSHKEPKVREKTLSVLRVDGMDGKPLAIMANLAAHPVMENIMDRRWSSEWPGVMQGTVETALGGTCLFMQGASGDMSPETKEDSRGVDGFGKAVGNKVIAMANGIETKVPAHPGVTGNLWSFSGPTRMDLKNPIVLGTFRQFFYPELMAMLVEMPDNTITLRGSTLLVNGEIALVGAAGELFSDLSNQIKAQSPAAVTLVFGYCNGHSLYVPTREALAEGGYGADATMSWLPVGTGEKVVEQAVSDIKKLMEGAKVK